MTKLCVPNVIKRVKMQVYNFLMRLNKTLMYYGMKVASVYVN